VATKHWGNNLDRESLVSAFGEAIRGELDSQNELTLLRPYGLTLATYRNEGHLLGDSVYNQIIYELGQRKLGLQFLCAGFDSDNAVPAQIFSIDGRGVESNFSLNGFWAIGSGQTNALGYLFSSGYRFVDGLDAALFHVCNAKFYAESALGVGKRTCVHIIRPQHQSQMLMTRALEPLRKLWERRQKSKVTKKEIETTDNILNTLGEPNKTTTRLSAGMSAGQQ
jgi:hypothetical protein